MNEERKKTLDPAARHATLIFVVGLGYLLFATFRPYFSSLIWSAVLSYGLYPQYCKIVKLNGDRRSLNALVMSIAVTIGVILCVSRFAIAVLDYVVRTIVVGGASKLHTLLTFFAVLGGIQFFGLVSIVAGPLVVAIRVALLDSYRAQRSGVELRSSEP